KYLAPVGGQEREHAVLRDQVAGHRGRVQKLPALRLETLHEMIIPDRTPNRKYSVTSNLFQQSPRPSVAQARTLSGADALAALERRAWLDYAEAAGDVEFSHRNRP